MPARTAAEFVEALRRRDEVRVWALLSRRAREYVIDVGEQRGLSADLAGRLRIGTAVVEERRRFQAEVVEGILQDLGHADLRNVTPVVEDETARVARVRLDERIPVAVGPPLPAVPVAWLHLTKGSTWLVERIEPAVRR